MTLWLLMTSVLTLWSSIGPAAAQKPPDLRGHWVAEADYRAVEDGREPFCDGECEIEQTDSLLTVRRGRARLVATYRLDGKPMHTVAEADGYRTEITTTASWSGNTLVIVIKTGRLPETRKTVSLEKGRLTVLGKRRSFERRRATTKVTYVRQSKTG
jgi:hypothetical protein